MNSFRRDRQVGGDRAGVVPGTLLFEGAVTDGQLVGTAFAFKRNCDPAPYAVSGPVVAPAVLTLVGPGPVRSGCSVSHLDPNSPHSELTFMGDHSSLIALLLRATPEETLAPVAEELVPAAVPASPAARTIAASPPVVAAPVPAPMAPTLVPATITAEPKAVPPVPVAPAPIAASPAPVKPLGLAVDLPMTAPSSRAVQPTQGVVPTPAAPAPAPQPAPPPPKPALDIDF